MLKLTELIARAPWREAVTYKDTWPHEYVLSEKDCQQDLLEAVCERFRAGEGVSCRFFRMSNTYLFIGDYKYWLMTHWDDLEPGEDYVLNRARLYRDRRDFVIQPGDSGKPEDYPTKKDYSVYTMRQASRRSWRIGQTRPVKVVFMSYRTTLQADALKLVGRKLQSSLAVEGELPEDGLAAYGDDDDDIMMALARKIVSGEEQDDAEGQQSLFSWAEFMAEEPVKPKGRSRKAQPASTSPFNWALDMEKEREEELIGLSA